MQALYAEELIVLGGGWRILYQLLLLGTEEKQVLLLTLLRLAISLLFVALPLVVDQLVAISRAGLGRAHGRHLDGLGQIGMAFMSWSLLVK